MLKHVRTTMLLPFCLGLVSLGMAQSTDWPTWRGPHSNSISAEKGWNPGALAGEVKPVWTKNVGAGWSAVAISGPHLYTMGNKDGTDTVFCLNFTDGSEVWRHSYPCKLEQYPGPRATPVCADGAVYTVSSSGDVFCLDAATGKVKWQKHLVTDLKAKPPRWGFAGSACLDGTRLLLNAGPSGCALDRATGNTVWSSGEGIGGYSTPVVFELEGTRSVALFGEKAVWVVDAGTGQPCWSHPWVTSYDVNAADPTISGNRLFITSGYNTGCALLEMTRKEARLVWQNKLVSSQFSSCVLLDGFLYGIDGNTGRQGQLKCVEFQTGTEKWSQPTGFGALMAADGKLIVLNEKGDLFVAAASPAGYSELAKCRALPSEGTKCWTMPVLCRGRIHCRNGRGDLVALDVSR